MNDLVMSPLTNNHLVHLQVSLFTFSLSLIILPISIKSDQVFLIELLAISMLLVFEKFSSVNYVSLKVFILSIPTKITVLEISNISKKITGHLTKAMGYVFPHFSLVNFVLLSKLVHALTLSLSTNVLAFILFIIGREHFLTLHMFKTIFELAGVYITRVISLFAKSLDLIINPFSFILISIFKYLKTIAILLSVDDFSFELAAILFGDTNEVRASFSNFTQLSQFSFNIFPAKRSLRNRIFFCFSVGITFVSNSFPRTGSKEWLLLRRNIIKFL
mmetsp:Transcript_66917/g.92629  ORF Transcript_66917/g.92629 Transcript_66917/m.92629 type:complete len:275 (+) Transcript_66917:706-1530(+)